MNTLWDNPVELEFPELFSCEDRKGFPDLEDDVHGIVIYADGINYLENTLFLRLMVSYCFSNTFIKLFNNIELAIKIVIENPSNGQSRCFEIQDPHKRYPSHDEQNYTDPSKSTKNQATFDMTSYVEIPLELQLENPGWGPSLFIRALLQETTSNILAFDLSEEGAMTSWKNSVEFMPILLSGEDDDD